MFKPLSLALIVVTVFTASINNPRPSLAGTCASKCGSRPIQFTPGQHIRIEVVNSTPNLVKIQKPSGTDAISLSPGQKLNLEQIEGTEPNTSLIFWSETGLSLQAIVSKPDFGTLRLELRPTWRSPGDRSLYIMDDGRINLL
ncbi:hypothetical protein VF14_05050 [Nostoc linckia z18]|jgi:hypothetical protein|uniref:Uncharacterized protein n=3 Tax=Nostoc TaxID=1177 RepID=A0A9Q5ZF16_NOSLI|nr:MULTISPECIES: hypothetical protein [Nostoc]MBL1199506.1 hypothetical protein [Nostoc sp. GBBB01]MDZ8011862.1 hypothetical protein [Nostoc sp. ZfuVER08]PHK28062.1 hypothetical protein VF12_33560 [Nostoc linckia z15]PHK47091.1 hypothetical protein VF13_07555 [Nostoc linckia z16]MBC1238067.1 hypothetical protein [Nostoc sp. 2RC]